MSQIQTIEGLSSTRSVIAVKKNKEGYCQAASFGPPGSAKASFKSLCHDARLPLGIGKGKRKSIGSRNGMANDMEFPPLEDLGQNFGPEFFGMGDMMDPERIKAQAVAGLAGGGGMLIVANIMERIDYLADKPKVKAAVTALLGLIGGNLMWSEEPGRQHMALGFAGGVMGMGFAKLASDQFEIPGGLSAVNVTGTPSYQYFSPTRGPVRQFFGVNGNAGQLAQPIVTDDDPIALDGFDAVEVAADQLGTWMG